MKRLAVILVPLALHGACGPDHGVVADPFPIGVDLSTGPLLAQIREGDGATQLAVIDLMAPLTVIDSGIDEAHAARRFADLTLLGTDGAGGTVPRAHLQLTVTELHPCPAGEVCRIGAPPGQIFDAVIGADAFDTGAVRVDFVRQELRLFPDIAGESSARGKLCEAVFPRPFEGGGKLSIEGTQVSFPARRIAVGACLSFDDNLEDTDLEDPDHDDSGVNALLVISTGIGPTILSRSAYERYRAVGGLDAMGDPAPDPETLTEAPQVVLPSGPLRGRRTTIDRLALVGSDNEVRGPCRQVFAHRLLSQRNCTSGDDCPCSDGKFCRVPAIVELTSGAIDVVIVDDDEPTLQALRQELRPDSPEVDGILGTAALASTSLDIDFPNDRVLARCASSTGCRARPELITESKRTLVADCLLRADEAEVEVDGGMPDATP